MTSIISLHVIFINENFLVDHFLDFANHLQLACNFYVFVIFIVNRHWIHPSTDSKSLRLEVVFEELNVHRCRSDDNLEIFSLLKQSLDEAEYHIDADRSLVSLIDHQTGIVRKYVIFRQFVKDQSIELEDDFCTFASRLAC
jgi:hypothetical protein